MQFLFGLFLGFLLGFILAALCNAARGKTSNLIQATFLTTGHMSKNIKTELRSCERFSPKKGVMIALIYRSPKHESNLIGSLIDISQSGLSFSYLPFSRHKTSIEEYCKVYFLGLNMPTEPIRCRRVNEVDIHDESHSSQPAKRVGLEFLMPLSTSELQTLVSV